MRELAEQLKVLEIRIQTIEYKITGVRLELDELFKEREDLIYKQQKVSFEIQQSLEKVE